MQKLKKRRSIRLPGYDYTQPGAYFITLCAYERQCLFGKIIDGAMHPNEIGCIVEQTWLETPHVRETAELDVFVVMPNHFHGIIVLLDKNQELHESQSKASGHRRAERLGIDRGVPSRVDGLKGRSLGAIMAQFKSLVTKRVKELDAPPDGPLWQRNYYDHIIRDEADLNRIREYITFNPQRWLEDQNNPLVFQKEISPRGLAACTRFKG